MALLTFQGQKILEGNGKASNTQMEAFVKKVYADFDAKRKAYEAELADQEDLRLLEKLKDEILSSTR